MPERASWFAALLRLWCLRAVPAVPPGSAVPTILVLTAVWCAAWVVIDHWQRQPSPEFAVEGVTLLGWYAAGLLGCAAVLRSRLKQADHHAMPGQTPLLASPTFTGVLVVALGAVPPPLLLMAVGSYFLDASEFRWASAAVALYELIYLARGLRALTGVPQRLAALSGVLVGAAFIWTSDALNAIPDVWNPSDPETVVNEDQLADREAALFEQADRIDAALEAIHRAAAARPEPFFLGFAGVGDQKVFAQEIALASQVVGERFGIGDRRLSLVNDERDLDREPLASVSGLQYALKAVASRMDLSQDVLFLAISSHGSEDPAIAVSNFDFPLQSLSAAELANALHESGIRWRVIIISACYAGGFIDSLRDPQTIVITAAAADRTSFGCSSDSDLTYFGEAFYRDALPRAGSLREAFETAKTAIAARENAEHETPSNPQAWFGAELEKKLEGSMR